MTHRSIGLEQGRKQLPQLAELAHSGQGSLLTKHGKPYAVEQRIEEPGDTAEKSGSQDV